jgi:hypothetical protein
MLRPTIVLAACFVSFASQSPVPTAKGDNPESLVAVLAARRHFYSYESLDDPEKLFKVVHYLKGDEPRDAVTDFEQLKGKYTSVELSEDQPLKKCQIGTDSGVRILVGSPEGLRAMFVRLPKRSIGEANVHCRVDLYGISKDNNHKEPELLIKNLLILAVEVGKEGVEGGVTFAVMPESAQVIDNAKRRWISV